MDLAKLFYVGGFSLIVLTIPTGLVFMAWWTRDRKASYPKAGHGSVARAADLHPMKQAA